MPNELELKLPDGRYDMDKIQRLGRRCGAEVAFFQNGEFQHFIKKGSAASKNCYLIFRLFNVRRYEWVSSSNTDLSAVVKFWRNLSHHIEIIEIDYSGIAKKATDQNQAS